MHHNTKNLKICIKPTMQQRMLSCKTIALQRQGTRVCRQPQLRCHWMLLLCSHINTALWGFVITA